jgi:hypothetical protein
VKFAEIFLLLALSANVLSAQILSPDTNLTAREEQIITASKSGSLTRIKSNPLAPPLGWNSYDTFGDSVVESEVLSNAQVLAVDQDALGKTARRIFVPGQSAEMWVKEISGGALAVGFFNRTENSVGVDYAWSKSGFSSAPQVRDLWLRKDLGAQENFTAELPPHGCILLRVAR